MEHRREYRLSITMPINIHSNQITLGCFDIKNISVGGICVNDIGNHLSKGDFVKLDLEAKGINKLDQCRQSEPYHMKAIVVYRDNNDVGLMWADDNPNFTYFLQKITSIAA